MGICTTDDIICTTDDIICTTDDMVGTTDGVVGTTRWDEVYGCLPCQLVDDTIGQWPVVHAPVHFIDRRQAFLGHYF